MFCLKVLRAFKGRSFRGDMRGSIQWNIHQLYTCVLSGSLSPLIGQHQGKGSLVNAAGPDVSHGITQSGFAALLGLELKHN